jgi:MFS family permease
VNLAPYRSVLAVPGVKALLMFGLVFRIPFLATGVLLTLHTVTTLGRSYAEAGLVMTAATVGAAVGQPLRGRAVDRVGLRRALLPSLVATAVLYCLAPFVGYGWLLLLVLVTSLVPLPVFTVVRQSLSAQVGPAHRRTAYSLDSMAVELSFMAGPAVGVWLATAWSTGLALQVAGGLIVLAGLGLLAYDPPTRSADGETGPAAGPRPRLQWTAPLVVVLAASVAATVVLAGTDVAIVAFARDHHDLGMTGPVFIAWGLGSMVGALLYGAWHHRAQPMPMLAALGLLTIPVGGAPSMPWLLLTILPAALVCAPIITATADAVAGLVDEVVLGEAIGWHGSAMTGGTALGAPLAGAFMDRWGPWAGFAVVGAVGLVLALTGLAVQGVATRRRAVTEAGWVG